MIELTHISKDFASGGRTVHAVQDVSLSIGKGEIFGIIGFSGAGKSTLVRCINLLERPTSGSVTVDGKEMTALSARELRQARKKIGMIFQHFNLMPSRTVFGNVAYPLRGSGLPGEKAYSYRLGGPTCLAGDIIGDYSFDRPLAVGDVLEFGDMAIYSMVKNNTFNGMPLPSIALRTLGGTERCIRSFGYEDFKQRLS